MMVRLLYGMSEDLLAVGDPAAFNLLI
jgi:hypothetical protein